MEIPAVPRRPRLQAGAYEAAAGMPFPAFYATRRNRCEPSPLPQQKPLEELTSAVIRFCGDSGDGMQPVGTQFTNVSAAFGNDVSTLPDSSRKSAPAGTLAGVSGFQLHFSSKDIFTPATWWTPWW